MGAWLAATMTTLLPALASAEVPWAKPCGTAQVPSVAALAASSTLLRVVPPPFGSVYLLDGGLPVASLDRPGTWTVPSGRTYGVLVMQGPLRIFSGQVPASGGVVDLAWSTATTPFESLARFASPPPAPQHAMSAADRDALLAAIEAAPFDRDKVSVVRAASQRHLFTVAEVHDILERLAFESSKLSALRALRGHIADPERGFELCDDFGFESSRRRVLAMFGG